MIFGTGPVGPAQRSRRAQGDELCSPLSAAVSHAGASRACSTVLVPSGFCVLGLSFFALAFGFVAVLRAALLS
jgi:hypothetical protein